MHEAQRQQPGVAVYLAATKADLVVREQQPEQKQQQPQQQPQQPLQQQQQPAQQANAPLLAGASHVAAPPQVQAAPRPAEASQAADASPPVGSASRLTGDGAARAAGGGDAEPASPTTPFAAMARQPASVASGGAEEQDPGSQSAVGSGGNRATVTSMQNGSQSGTGGRVPSPTVSTGSPEPPSPVSRPPSSRSVAPNDSG